MGTSMKRIPFIARCIAIVAIALIIMGSLIENDPWFRAAVEQKIVAAFTQSLECSFATKVSSLHLIGGSIELTDAVAQSAEKENLEPTWRWQADRLTIKFSVWQLLFRQRIVADLTVDRIAIHSTVIDGKLAIADHVQRLTSQGSLSVPFIAQRIHLQKATLSLGSPDSLVFESSSAAKIELTKEGMRLQTTIFTGHCNFKQQTVFQKLQGRLDYSTNKQQSFMAKFAGKTELLGHLVGIQSKTENNTLITTITTPKKLLDITSTLDLTTHQLSAEGTIPLASLCKLFDIPKKSIDGSLFVTLATQQTAEPSYVFTTQLRNTVYRGISIPEVEFTAEVGINNLQEGRLKLLLNKNTATSGTFSYTAENGTLQTELTMPESEEFRMFGAVFKKLRVTTTLTKDWQLASQCNGLVQYQTETSTFDGSLHLSSTQLSIKAQQGSRGTYALLAEAKPHWQLTQLDAIFDNKPLIKIRATDKKNGWDGTISYAVLRAVTQGKGFAFPEEGALKIIGSTEYPTIKIGLLLDNAHIRLPYTYNLVQQAAANIIINLTKRTITAEQLRIQLHKGEVTASTISARFNEQFQLAYLHAPLLINNCFLSRKKDFFALFSGSLTLQYLRGHRAQLSGFVMLDRSHIQSNIFSQDFQRQLSGTTALPFSLYGTDIDFNVHLMTSSPLQVKTSFLEGAARIKGALQGSTTSPAITGEVELVHGSFLFPYKPLFIKRGKVYFLPQQIDDPVVDILAENSMRNYAVRMTVTGTARQPHIAFDATPTLQEEQIISLLLGGSEEGSLYVAVPTSVMNSIENMIFGPSESTSRFQRTLQDIFAPLKNMRLIPSFTSQTGRGGLRGSLALEVNDRLRATIQQNFSLPEDTLIEVEYALSDDARVRAVKDERGDLGAELEGRWRF